MMHKIKNYFKIKNKTKILTISTIALLLMSVLFIACSNEDTIIIIPLKGEIGYETGMLSPEDVQEAFNEAEEDNSASAILLEVNSPGGTPVASAEIMQTIRDCKKPVVTWISDTGASGAYLAASGADKITASKSSMVGSIGVIMNLQDLSKYYQNNGEHNYSIKSGKYKDMGAKYRSLTLEEQEMLQNIVNEEYNNFISIVAENRGLDKNYVKSISEGQIFTGLQAQKLKLIDDISTKKQALDIAAQLGGIQDKKYKTKTIHTQKNTLELLF